MPATHHLTKTAFVTTRLRQAAVPFLFFLFGLVFASWSTRIPALRDALHLSAEQLGMILLCGGGGSIFSFPLTSSLIRHYGVKRAAALTGLGLLLIIGILPWMPSLGWLMSCMVGMGIATSGFDVSINVLGAESEKTAGRSIMSLLHAWFCVGTLSGALLGSALAGMAITPRWHFGVTCTTVALPLWLAYQVLPHDRPDYALDKPKFSHGALVMLGIIGFCCAITESSIADWSGVFMKDCLSVS